MITLGYINPKKPIPKILNFTLNNFLITRSRQELEEQRVLLLLIKGMLPFSKADIPEMWGNGFTPKSRATMKSKAQHLEQELLTHMHSKYDKLSVVYLPQKHTAINILDCTKAIITKWQWKVIAEVTDGASNMESSVRQLNHLWVHCYAHRLNLCMQETLPQPFLAKINALKNPTTNQSLITEFGPYEVTLHLQSDKMTLALAYQAIQALQQGLLQPIYFPPRILNATVETSRQNILHEIKQRFSLIFCSEEWKQALEQTLNLKSTDVVTMVPEVCASVGMCSSVCDEKAGNKHEIKKGFYYLFCPSADSAGQSLSLGVRACARREFACVFYRITQVQLVGLILLPPEASMPIPSNGSQPSLLFQFSSSSGSRNRCIVRNVCFNILKVPASTIVNHQSAENMWSGERAKPDFHLMEWALRPLEEAG
ncbi:hypothetical protein Pelo_8179 [Pelomyxa schiedti]|nr:hypothetical protein Pelo_8179 [Pelomyxa schiedti]